MSYSKTTWTDGDTITAQNLNKMENGIASAYPLIILDNSGTLNKTWQEIYDAFSAGRTCYVQYYDSSEGVTNRYMLYYVGEATNYYSVRIGDNRNNTEFAANTSNGYPQYVD